MIKNSNNMANEGMENQPANEQGIPLQKLRELFRRAFFSQKTPFDTASDNSQVTILGKRMNRRNFLKAFAAVGTATSASMLLPGEASGQLASFVTEKPAPPVDGTAWPVEQYHFNKMEARAMYDRAIEQYGYDRFLFAVSEDYPLPESFPTDEAEIPLVDAASLGISTREGVQVGELAASSLTELFEAAQAAGFTPYLTSGFRSLTYQARLFSDNISREMQNHGYTQEQAETQVLTYSARPRTSEHHLGTAFDIWASPNESWDNARANYNKGFYQWVRDNAHKYGFVLSFPAGRNEYEAKESSAVRSSEPWHLRFIGKEVAEYFFRCNYLNSETSASVHTLLIDPYFES